jgi:hypothetical protein
MQFTVKHPATSFPGKGGEVRKGTFCQKGNTVSETATVQDFILINPLPCGIGPIGPTLF